MARAYLQLPTEGTGKALLTSEFTEAGAPAPNSGVREIQALLLADSAGNFLDSAASAIMVGTERGLVVRPLRPATSTAPTPTRVALSTTVTTLLSSNTARRGVVIHNDSSGNLWIKYGTAASATSYVYKLAPGQHFEMPDPIYTGDITGIWDGGAGSATVTELV